MADILSNKETAILSSASVVCIGGLISSWKNDGEPIYASIALSGTAFCLSYAIIRWTGSAFKRAGLKGRDMSKAIAVEM